MLKCLLYNLVGNTWERKTISLPADASGLINDDNGRGLGMEFWLNSGSTYTGGSAQTLGVLSPKVTETLQTSALVVQLMTTG